MIAEGRRLVVFCQPERIIFELHKVEMIVAVGLVEIDPGAKPAVLNGAAKRQRAGRHIDVGRARRARARAGVLPVVKYGKLKRLALEQLADIGRLFKRLLLVRRL